MAALHIASIFLSAFLLFLVQPMIAKALLPEFGGSPAVWGTCLVVFQGLLLLGYASADRVRRLPPRTLLVVQGAIVLLPLLLLPPALRTAPPGPSAWPVPALVLALAASVAAPFFALSTNSTLVQSGYARTVGREPYFLYAASNAGSLLALAAYPFLVEPMFTLTEQRRAFAAGYLGFAGLTIALGLLAIRRTPVDAKESGAVTGAPLTWSQRRHWMWLAAIPSGLLVATTLHISTDVAAVPLLWVIPLALYLLSFVIAFLPRPAGKLGVFPRDTLVLVTRALVAASLVALHESMDIPYTALLVLTLGTLFAGAWLCHGEIAASRPAAGRLGEFYLWVSAGGLLGGVFGNLIAPLVFVGVVEYPIFLACLAFVGVTRADFRSRRAVVLVLITLMTIVAPAIAAVAGPVSLEIQLLPFVILPIAIAARKRPERFAIAATGLAIYVTAGLGLANDTLAEQRSFFGVVRVVEHAKDLRVMTHGTTVHGHEFRQTPYPIGYYSPDAPIHTVVRLTPPGGRIAVLGLGTGAIADLAVSGQQVDFYEIDPIVEPLADRYFQYLKRSRARGTGVSVVVGDARLTIARAEDASYDLIVMDAFTSDAIPIHLITRDAIALYLRKLKPGGRILAHVSNNYLDVVPVVRGAAVALELEGVRIEWVPSADQIDWGATASNIVVLARTAEPLAPLFERTHEPWTALGSTPVVEWTDERSSLLEVLR